MSVDALNRLGANWVDWFLPLVMQNTVFLVLVFGVLYALRRAPAGLRAAVATVGLLKLAVPPFLPVGWLRTPVAREIAEPVGTLLFPLRGTGEAMPVTAVTGGLEPAAVVMLVWLNIVAVTAIVMVAEAWQLRTVLRRSTPVPDAELPQEFGRNGLSIRCCSCLSLPLTMGLYPATIFVPRSWRNWTAADRLSALRHERAHLRRRDGWVQPLEILVRGVFLFHPLVILLVRRLRIWREMACDDASAGPDAGARLSYSRFLLSLAETALHPRPTTESAPALARRRSDLHCRVAYQMKESPMSKSSRRRSFAIIAALIVASLPLSLVFGSSAPTEAGVPAASAPAAAVASAESPRAPLAVEPCAPPSRLHVGIREDGLLLNDVRIALPGLEAALEAVAPPNVEPVPVVIDCAPDVPVSRLHEVQLVLQQTGFDRVIYSGDLADKVPLVLPPPAAIEALDKLPPELVLNVNLAAGGEMRIAGRDAEVTELSSIASRKLSETEHLVVAVQADKDTPYSVVVAVLDQLKSAGATRIALLDPVD